MLNNVLEKVNGTLGIVKFDETNILIDIGDTLPGYTTLKKLWY